jgi:hypothetical protein
MDILESLLQTQLGVFGKLRNCSTPSVTATLASTTTLLPCGTGCSTQFHAYVMSLAHSWQQCLNLKISAVLLLQC